jgi:N-dimethylarginine dimethylaminohydrolase
LLVGYGPRTSEGTLHYLRETLVRDGLVDEIVGIHLAPWRLNIDGCFFPVSGNTIVTNRDSVLDGVVLDGRGTRSIDPFTWFPDHGFGLVEVTREESFFQQVCNFACLGANRVVAYGMNERVNNILRDRGLEVRSVPGDQLVKGNGGPHCMTRPIFRSRG